MRLVILLIACIACGGGANQASETSSDAGAGSGGSSLPPEQAVQGVYVGSLRSVGYVYDFAAGEIARSDVTSIQRIELTATGPDAVMLHGNLGGGDCTVPVMLKSDGTLTFAGGSACSTNPEGSYVFIGAGRWDDSGRLVFSVLTGQGVTSGLYYDETFADSHKL